MNTQELLALLNNYFVPLGLEVHLFKSLWYNDQVSEIFKLKLDDDTICAVILSTPSFFEKAFIPYLKSCDVDKLTRDPIDACISEHVLKLKNVPELRNLNVTALFDYELLPNRRPKLLVQTAAHVAGAAFYYQRFHAATASSKKDSGDFDTTGSIANSREASQASDELLKEPWDEKEKIFGVCIHPTFGGWFAIRAAVIFHDVIDSSLVNTPPSDCVPTREGRITLLNLFNKNWQDWKYRDVIPVQARYSELQKKYFSTLPKDRKKLICSIISM